MFTRCDECFWASPWKEPYRYGIATYYKCMNSKSKHYGKEVGRGDGYQCFKPKTVILKDRLKEVFKPKEEEVAER